MGGTANRERHPALALFGEVTVRLGDKFTLAVGARQHDQDNYSQTMTPTSQAPLYVNRQFARDPLAGVKYNPAPQRGVYAFFVRQNHRPSVAEVPVHG